MTHPGATERIVVIEFDYLGDPIGKPRMTRQDKWLDPPRKCVSQWWAFKGAFLIVAKQAGYDPSTDAIRMVKVRANIAMPRSWSKVEKARQFSLPHLQKPDADNILKAVADALTDDDSGIYHMEVTKFWRDIPCLSVHLRVIRSGLS